jgi:hypothetical protein
MEEILTGGFFSFLIVVFFSVLSFIKVTGHKISSFSIHPNKHAEKEVRKQFHLQ